MLLMNSHEEAGSHAEVQQSAHNDRKQTNNEHKAPPKTVNIFPAWKLKCRKAGCQEVSNETNN